jgi:hypothetical protein
MDISPEGVLRSYAHSSRQQMARSRGLDHKGKGSEALVAMLQPVLYSAVGIRQALQELSPAERALVDHLVLLGGTAPTSQLRHLLTKEKLVDPEPRGREAWGMYREEKGSPWNLDSRNFADLVARLGVLGLVYSSNPGIGGSMELSRPGYRLYIPDAVLEHLPAVSLPLETTQPPALVVPSEPSVLLRDVYVLLSVAGERPIPLTKAGLIVKRSLTQLNDLLRVQEDVAAARSEDELPYLSWLHALAEELHLLAARSGELRLTEGALTFLALPRGERRRQLFAAYRRTPLWGEVFAIPGLSLKTPAGGRRPVPPLVVAARERVINEIDALPPERWISVEHLIDRLRRTAYEFLLPRRWQNSNRYSYGYVQQPNPYSGENEPGWVFEQITKEADGWDKVEAGFVRVVVTQTLRWLGVVDLGFRDERAVAFRVTADGARLLHDEPLPEAEPAAPNVVIQPNFQVFAFEPTEESILFRLDQLADRVRLEQAGEYRLSRESFIRAQRAGWNARGAVQFLQEVSSVPVPQNVRRSIEEWGAEQERVVIRRGVALVHAADAATLDTLFADPALAPLLGRRATPTAAIVTPASLGALQRLLLERGQVAAISEGPDEVLHPVFRIDADGRIALQDPVPSIFVLHAVQPFVEGEPPSGMRVTPASLRRAARGGLTAPQVLAVLTSYAQPPLPPEVTALVQRWAKDWGRSALVGASILQVDQAATLSDLLADPAIGRYLTPVPDVPTLAIVRSEGVAAVREGLAARGVDISDQLLRP